MIEVKTFEKDLPSLKKKITGFLWNKKMLSLYIFQFTIHTKSKI